MMFDDIRTMDDLYHFAAQYGLEATKGMLRLYVEKGQPKEFAGEATSRAMCRCASAAIEGREDDYCIPCVESVYGGELYSHMWQMN